MLQNALKRLVLLLNPEVLTEIIFLLNNLQKERDIIQHKKEDLEKKNIQILREHKFLRDRITKLEQQLKDKRDMEKKFNKDIDDLNQVTISLVEEIEKWQM